MKTLVTDRAGRFAWLKAATLTLLLWPAAVLVYRAAMGDLGPLPLKEALHVAGDWAVRFLVLTLALTPLQRLLAWPRLALVRRMTGVGSFAYAALHIALYVAGAKFDLAFVATEIALRIYLTVGFVALVGLAALAATSTDAAVRRLGRRWKTLHRLVYAIAALGLLHYFMQSKIDVSAAVLMTGYFLLLMTYRLAVARGLGLTPPVLAGVALTAGLATAVVEFAWYGLATGIDPWRIAAANLMLTYGLRPAMIVALSGLAVAAVPLLRGVAGRVRIRLRPRLA